jgi:hypothetical protein
LDGKAKKVAYMHGLRLRAKLSGTKSTINEQGTVNNSDSQAFGSDLQSLRNWASGKLAKLSKADKKTAIVEIFETTEKLVESYFWPAASSEIRPTAATCAPGEDFLCIVCGASNCATHSQAKPNLHRKD